MKRLRLTAMVASALLLSGSIYALANLSSEPAEIEDISLATLANEGRDVQQASEAPSAFSATVMKPGLLRATGETPRMVESMQNTLKPVSKANAGVPKGMTIADLAGDNYIITYKSLVSSRGDQGGNVAVVPVAGTDSVIIKNFYADWDVKAHVNVTTGVITIPYQQLGTNSDGMVYFATCTNEAKSDKTTAVTAQIKADGTVSSTDWWGFFVDVNGKEYYYYLGFNAALDRGNAKMNCTNAKDNSVTSYWVKATQTADNEIAVMNFGNKGCTVKIDINRKRTGIIAPQVVWNYPQNGANFITATYQNYDPATGNVSGILMADIPLDTAAQGQNRVISWGKWTAFSRGTANYVNGVFTKGEIVFNEDIRWPQLNVNGFEGQGTQADPYLIKNRDDLIYLSATVEDIDEFPDHTVPDPSPSQYYARAYLGKYFKVTADIDMSNYKFTPIANDWKHNFAGTFDGDGHTIRNLTIDVPQYAGLFGHIDTVAVVKNLTFENADITANGAGGYYGAVCVGWSLGTIDNVHVKNSTVISEAKACGAIAASGRVITNCTATKTQVAGAGGWVAGIAGELTSTGTDNKYRGKIENCHVIDGVIYPADVSKGSGGGVVGTLRYSDGNNLSFKGVVDGQKLKTPTVNGGVAGIMYNATLRNSMAVGQVFSYTSDSYVGGLVGQVNGGVLENCYFHGQVASNFSRRTGGITGYVAGTNTFRNLYTVSVVTGETYQYNTQTGAFETLGEIVEGSQNTIENVYWDTNLTNLKSATGTGKTTVEMTAAAGLPGFSADVWTFREGFYPRLTALTSQAASNMAASCIYFEGGANVNKVNHNLKINRLAGTSFGFYVGGKVQMEGHFAKVDGDSIKINNDFGTDTLFCINGNSAYYYMLKISPVPFAGSGTQEDPYLIKTKNDLIALSQATTTNKQYFPGCYFKQTNDIDLEYSRDFIGIASDPADAHSAFEGNYDGGGFSIHKMHIRGVVWTEGQEPGTPGVELPKPFTGTNGSFGYQGFIGRLAKDGVLRNLNMAADCDFEWVWATVAPFVGQNSGLIENCRNYADMNAVSCWVGGIVGMNQVSGIIRDCYNEGNITTGYNAVGGISGSNNGIIENCANVGIITAKRIANFGKSPYYGVGGITGQSNGGKYINVLNAGMVQGDDRVGGLCGTMSRVTSLGSNYAGYNEVDGGLVYGTGLNGNMATCGAIGGCLGTTVPTEAAQKGLYYDAQILPWPALKNTNRDDMKGVETSFLISGQPIEGLSAEKWTFTAGNYPILKTFANEPKLVEASKTIMTIPTGKDAADLAGITSTLSGNATWTVAPYLPDETTTPFSVADGKLIGPASVQKVTEAMLKGKTASGYNKYILVTALPACPLTGDGTEASPWLIKTTDDWNNFSAYVDNTANNLDGKFVRLDADLDFTGKEFKPMFSDGVTALFGTFDGANHTVKGIAMTTTNTYQAPMGQVSATGVIKNLTLEGAVQSSKGNTGGFTAKMAGKLINCVSKVNVTTGAASYCSGFGEILADAELTDCYNKGNITSSSTYVAGVSCKVNHGAKLTRCGNEGTITSNYKPSATTTTSINTAGFVAQTYAATYVDCYNKGGFVLSETHSQFTIGVSGFIATLTGESNNTDTLTFINCHNEADVYGGYQVAGFISLNNANSGSALLPVKMINCWNSGDVTATYVNGTTAKSPMAGGFLCYYGPQMYLENCYNTGNVTTTNLGTYTAGLVAYYKTQPTAALPTVIKNCWNSGDVTSGGNQVGGIMSYCGAYVTIDGCYNTGNLATTHVEESETKTNSFGVGGIVCALANPNSIVKNCWNAGNVTTTGNRAGGIVAWGASGTIENCFNLGHVKSTGNVKTNSAGTGLVDGYAIGGIAAASSHTITNCYNMGVVEGKCQVGGIVGQPSKGKTKINNCYQAGTIVAPADTAGYIVGVNTDNAKIWADGNELKNCYYIPQKEAPIQGMSAGGATAKTLAEMAALTTGLSDQYVYGDAYTLPMLVGMENDYAKTWAASVVLKDADASSNIITGSFFLGMPADLTWTASIPNVKIWDGANKATWTTDKYNGNFTMTAKVGEITKVHSLTASWGGGVETLDGALLISETWYTTDGLKIAKPENRDGRAYIVVRRYTDGTTRTVKVMN